MGSADSWRMSGIECMGTMKLVLDSVLLWMGGEPLLVLVWRSIEDEFTGKWELDIWVVMQIAYG